jgi:hypothetical protein
VRVRRFREGIVQWWCEFNASVSAREGRQRDKVLQEDETDAATSSWLNEKKVSLSAGGEAASRR